MKQFITLSAAIVLLFALISSASCQRAPGKPDCSDKPDGYRFSDLSDCTRYWECQKGEAVSQKCVLYLNPGGEVTLYFDSVSKVNN